MKGEFTMRILEALADSALGVVDLVEVFLTSGYGASQGKMRYELERRQQERERRIGKQAASYKSQHTKEEQEKVLKERFYQMLSRLERDGLVKKTKKGKSGIFTVTTRGKKKLDVLQKRYEKVLPPACYTPLNTKRKKLIIAIFDIPEQIRHKRTWLRTALISLGFNPIQKSVWAGNIAVPVKFLNDLRDLKIAQYVEIFEITKRGSIAQLK